MKIAKYGLIISLTLNNINANERTLRTGPKESTAASERPPMKEQVKDIHKQKRKLRKSSINQNKRPSTLSTSIGNGGNVDGLEFIAIGREIYSILNLMSNQNLYEIGLANLNLENFSTELDNIKVEMVNGPLFSDDPNDKEEKTAINLSHSSPKLILVDKDKWPLIQDQSKKYSIVLHEYLGVLGKKDLDYKYQVSSKFYSLVKSKFAQKLNLNISSHDYLEDELLKVYLNAKSSKTKNEIQSIISKLNTQRDAYDTYNNKWWDRGRIEHYHYWDTFFEGRNLAREVKREQGRGNNYCKLIVKLAKTNERRSELKEAFKRGVVSAYPECFIDNLMGKIHQMDKQVDAIGRNLFGLKKTIDQNKPDLIKARGLAKKIRGEVGQIYTAQAADLKDRLINVFKFSDDVWNEIKFSKNIIHNEINLQNSDIEPGELVLKRADNSDLTDSDVLRIFLGVESYDQYTDQILTFAFRKRVRSFAKVQRNNTNVKSELNNIDNYINEQLFKYNEQVNLAIERSSKEIDEKLELYYIGAKYLWRDFYPDIMREATIDAFFNVKNLIEAYRRLESGSEAEYLALNALENKYRSVLFTATDMSFDVSLPALQVFIEIPDTKEQVAIDLYTPEQSRGYLLGDNYDESKSWEQFLTIE